MVIKLVKDGLVSIILLRKNESFCRYVFNFIKESKNKLKFVKSNDTSVFLTFLGDVDNAEKLIYLLRDRHLIDRDIFNMLLERIN